MTWFDALLITLLGMLGALGLRRGAAGLIWGGLCLLAVYLTNRWSGSLGLWGTLALALALGTVAALLAQSVQDMIEQPYHTPPLWSSSAGLLGGIALGAALVAAFALSFPLSPRVDAAGIRYLYPSPEMAPGLRRAVESSALKNSVMPLWQTPSSWQTLVLPDLPELTKRRQP